MRTITLGAYKFLEIPGETLREAARTAVLAARDSTPGGVFDVTVRGFRGTRVLTAGDDEAWIASGVAAAYEDLSATASVVKARSSSTSDEAVLRQPSVLEIRQKTSGDLRRYEITFLVTEDGTSRSRLFQETKATLTPAAWMDFLRRQVLPCLVNVPRPFRVALAVGGTSAEASLGTALRADGGELDHLPDVGGEGGEPIRLPDLEAEFAALLEEELGGHTSGRACSHVRIVRMVRHGGSLPIGLYIGLPTDRRVRVTLTPLDMEVTLASPELPFLPHGGT